MARSNFNNSRRKFSNQSKPTAPVVERELPAPSSYGKIIMDAVFGEKKHPVICISALAGSGKTTMAEHIARKARANGTHVTYAAFMKRNAVEMQTKITGITIGTCHSIGFSLFRNIPGLRGLAFKVDGDKYKNMFLAHGIEDEVAYVLDLILTAMVERRISFVDAMAVVEANDTFAPHEALVEKVRAQGVTRDGISKYGVSFTDMLEIPLVYGVPYSTDMLIVDEFQDLNPLQHEFWSKAIAYQRIFIGDINQSIYRFNGAVPEIFQEFIEKYPTFDLPINYRCSTSVLERAKVLVPGIIAHEGAEEGSVSEMNYSDMVEVTEGLVICRKNLPILKLAYNLIKAGNSDFAVHKDVVGALFGLTFGLDSHTVSEALEEVRNLIETKKQGNANPQTIDRLECLSFLLDNSKETTLKGFRASLYRLFPNNPEKAPLRLSSIHSAKGLEAEKVYWIEGVATNGEAIEEEVNLPYVAITRAKRHLFVVRMNSND